MKNHREKIDNNLKTISVLLNKHSYNISLGGSYVLFLNKLVPSFDDVDVIVYSHKSHLDTKKEIIASLSSLYRVENDYISNHSQYEKEAGVFYMKSDQIYINFIIKKMMRYPQHWLDTDRNDGITIHGMNTMPVGVILRAKQEYGRIKDVFDLAGISEVVKNPKLLVRSVDVDVDVDENLLEI